MSNYMKEKTERNTEFSAIQERYLRAKRDRQAEASTYECLTGEEETDRREGHVKHFDLGEDRHQAIVYPDAVHYRDADSPAWEEIDNNLIDAGDVLINKKNKLRVTLSKHAGEKLITLSEGGRAISWTLLNANPVPCAVRDGEALLLKRLEAEFQLEHGEDAPFVDERTAEEKRSDMTAKMSEATYEDIAPGVTVRYTLRGDTVKEDIILSDASAAERAAILLTNDYRYEADAQARVTAYDLETGAPIYTFDAPLTYDANGSSTVAAVSLERTEHGTIMRYAPDAEYLAAAEYPVTIDPVVKNIGATDGVEAYYWKMKSDVTSGNKGAKLTIGKKGSSEYGVCMRFNMLAALKSSDTVVSAQLKITNVSRSKSKNRTIAAYEITTPWKQDTDWNDIKYKDEVVDYAMGGKSTMTLSFTDLYRKWYRADNGAVGASENNGVLLKLHDSLKRRSSFQIYNNDESEEQNKVPKGKRPYFTVNYVSHAGIKSWWTYEQLSADRAGTAYVDLFNGNLIHAHGDAGTSGSRMPVSVAHYYNSCLSEQDNYYCGPGWKLSAQQSVESRTIAKVKYFVYTDGEGTEHYFRDRGHFTRTPDMEGMGLILQHQKKNKNRPHRIEITDQSQMKMYFFKTPSLKARVEWKKFWLSEITDTMEEKNRMAFTYELPAGDAKDYTEEGLRESEGKLIRITDGSGREVHLSYVDEKLIEITEPAHIQDGMAAESARRSVSFGYDGAKLKAVTYSEMTDAGIAGPHTTFEYIGGTNLLMRAGDYYGARVEAQYEGCALNQGQIGVDEYADFETDEEGNVSEPKPIFVEGNNELRRAVSLEAFVLRDNAVAARGAKLLFEYASGETKVISAKTENDDSGKAITYQFNDRGNVVSVRDELGFSGYASYSGEHENTVTGISKLSRVVVNLLKHPDMAKGWRFSTNTEAAYDNKDAGLCLGMRSAKLQRENKAEPVYAYQDVSLTAGKSYTFSAYVKTNSLPKNGDGAYLAIGPASDFAQAKRSYQLTGTTNPDINNLLPTDGWDRLSATYTPAANETVRCAMVDAGMTGTAWFAAPQLEEGEVANSVNLLTDGDFKDYDEDIWKKGGDVSKNSVSRPGDMPSALSGKALSMTDKPRTKHADVHFTQEISIAGKKGDVFTAGGWAKAKAMPNSDSDARAFRITVKFYVKKSGKYTWIYGNQSKLHFKSASSEWQPMSGPVTAPDAYSKVQVIIVYCGQPNEGSFTNIFLHRESFGKSFVLDSNKNLMEAQGLGGQRSNMKYDRENNLVSYRKPGRDKDATYTLSYGSSDERIRHLVRVTTTPMQVMGKYEYDVHGNQVRAVSTGKKEKAFIETRTEYDKSGNYAVKKIDARKKAMVLKVDENTGRLKSATDARNTNVAYTYDELGRLTEASSKDTDTGRTYMNKYTYEDNRMTGIAHNTASDTETDVQYNFEYDDIGAVKRVLVGAKPLSENAYSPDRYHNLMKSTYKTGTADGAVQDTAVDFEYDDFNRLKKTQYGNSAYTYDYGANGQVAKVKQWDNNGGALTLKRSFETEYDLAQKPKSSRVRGANGERIYEATVVYDKLGRLDTFEEMVGNTDYATEYDYDNDDRITKIEYDGEKHAVEYTYDRLGRVKERVARSITKDGDTEVKREIKSEYKFVAGGYGKDSTTPLVESIEQPGGSWGYQYDEVGNIKSVAHSGKTESYEYDRLGQLTRVNDPHANETWKYEYDRGGNIVSKAKHAYTTAATLGTATQQVMYTYDATWKDLLTAYGDKPITYDGIGNPRSYDGWQFTWQNGRQLAEMKNAAKTARFDYDQNGLRVGKTVGTTHTDYYLHGKLIMGLKQDSNLLHFYYDAATRPAMVKMGGKYYTYVANLQGDITAILDSMGKTVVRYSYDAWGKPIEVWSIPESDTVTAEEADAATKLKALNPFRYRGYVWDDETELYYLRSRYYSPEWGRFISIDSTFGKIGKMFSHNLFAYCQNSPVVFVDLDGTSPYLSLITIVFYEDEGGTGHVEMKIRRKEVTKVYSFGQEESRKGKSSSKGCFVIFTEGEDTDDRVYTEYQASCIHTLEIEVSDEFAQKVEGIITDKFNGKNVIAKNGISGLSAYGTNLKYSALFNCATAIFKALSEAGIGEFAGLVNESKNSSTTALINGEILFDRIFKQNTQRLLEKKGANGQTIYKLVMIQD